jgi:hypothetical protein
MGCVLRSAMIRVILHSGENSRVFLSYSKLCGQWSSGRGRRLHIHEGKAQAGTAFRGAAHAIRGSSVYRRIRLAGIGWDSLACGGA